MVETESDDSDKPQQIEMKTEADSDDVAERPCYSNCDTQRGRLNDHRRKLTADKLYSCTQCEKRYSSQHALSLHMNIHQGKFKCAECGKCCQSRGELQYTGEVIQERNRLNVLYVADDIKTQEAL